MLPTSVIDQREILIIPLHKIVVIRNGNLDKFPISQISALASEICKLNT